MYGQMLVPVFFSFLFFRGLFLLSYQVPHFEGLLQNVLPFDIVDLLTQLFVQFLILVAYEDASSGLLT